MTFRNLDVVQMFLGSPQSVLVPAQIGVIIWLIYASLGPATFAGLGIIFLVLPFLAVILSKLIKYHYAHLNISDKRVKLSSEILQGIRILKFYGTWRCLFEKCTSQSRLTVVLCAQTNSSLGRQLSWSCE